MRTFTPLGDSPFTPHSRSLPHKHSQTLSHTHDTFITHALTHTVIWNLQSVLLPLIYHELRHWSVYHGIHVCVYSTVYVFAWGDTHTLTHVYTHRTPGYAGRVLASPTGDKRHLSRSWFFSIQTSIGLGSVVKPHQILCYPLTLFLGLPCSKYLTNFWVYIQSKYLFFFWGVCAVVSDRCKCAVCPCSERIGPFLV